MTNRNIVQMLSVSAVLLACSGVLIAGELDGLRAGHPRLLVKDHAVWKELSARAEKDVDLKKLLRAIQADADRVLDLSPEKRVMVGRRLLGVSRSVLWRVGRLSAAFRLTGDRKYLDRAVREMQAAASFSDWNPSHFLDVAEMTAALAIGYDWLYDELTEAQRRTIAQAIVEKGLRPALDKKHWWQTRDNNWNQVCYGGLVLGALAVADVEPELAEQQLQSAKRGFKYGLKPYAPDGVYPEGPNYWHYGTVYSVLMIEALRTALGTDWGVVKEPGFLPSGAAYVQVCGPTGVMYNFSDGSQSANFRPALFWFAREVKDPGLLSGQSRLIESKKNVGSIRFAPLAALWWPPAGLDARCKLPLRWAGDGPNPVAAFRESWHDPNAMYLGLKGGKARVNHGHMDAGSFILEADGVRWGLDLKQQSYHTLESKGINIWRNNQDATRWKIFRYSPHAHSTLTIDGQLHQANGFAPVRFHDGKNPHAVVDLTAVFARQATKVTRGFQWKPGREVLIQDELSGLKPGAKVRWAMVTGAGVDCDGKHATLRQSHKTLHAQVSGAARLKFTVIPANPPDDGMSAPNPGKSLLLVHGVADKDGALQIVVRLRPGAEPKGDSETVLISKWSTGSPE